MPATPYAKLLVSVDGGANTDGGIDIPSDALVQFNFESVVGWLRAKVEIYDYPEGWATPAGWTLAASGTIYWDWTGVPPPAITMPSNSSLWGVWMPRLLVNEQIDTSTDLLAGLIDADVTALCMLSPSGLRSSGAREKLHFTSSATQVKGHLRSYQRNLRALENPIISKPSTSTTPVVIRRYVMTTGDVKVLRAVVKVRNSTGSIYGEYEVKGAYRKLAGVIGALYAVSITTVIESSAGLNVTVTLDANLAVQLNGVGLAATALTWEAQEMFF